MIAFEPPHFVALFKGGEKDHLAFIGKLDVDRGEASYFGGYPLPADRIIGFAADAASNQTFVATESAIYKFTAKRQSLEWPSFGWEAIDAAGWPALERTK